MQLTSIYIWCCYPCVTISLTLLIMALCVLSLVSLIHSISYFLLFVLLDYDISRVSPCLLGSGEILGLIGRFDSLPHKHSQGVVVSLLKPTMYNPLSIKSNEVND